MAESQTPPPHADHVRVLTEQEQVDSTASSAQHALMLRCLRHSQLQNALIRHKAQRFVALKTLHRSAELRRHLSRAEAAGYSSVPAASSTTPPPLDPSVKALIDKLTEIADILPCRYSGDQPGQTGQRAFYVGAEPNTEQQSTAAGCPPRAQVHATEGKPPLAATTTERAAPRGLSNGKDGTVHGSEGSARTDNLTPTNEADADDDDDGFGSEGMGMVVGDPLAAPLTEDFMGSTEEDDILTQQLRELDSSVGTVFQDLERKGKKSGSKDSELPKKTGAPENLSKKEDEERKREEDNRQKEKAALLAQLEGLSGGGHTRRPKWRWIADGVDDPDPDRVLKGKQLWKAAALLVIVFFVRPRRTLMQRKAR